MILFVGEKQKLYFADEVIQHHNESIMSTGYSPHIADIKEKVLENNYTHIIVDCEQFIDPYYTIATELYNLKSLSGFNFIILAIGYDVESELIQALYEQGFKNYILDNILSNQKIQLKNCLENKNHIDIPASLSNEIPFIKSDNIPESKHKSITVAFVGSSSRIGTTTHAIQYIRYLQFMGKTACYISIDPIYIETLRIINNLSYKDEKFKMLKYKDIDMYNEPEELINILKLNYDFFVLDYGNMEDNNFPFFSFLERDVKICVCGSKSNEIISTNFLINKTSNQDIFYLFNFTDETNKNDVLEYMGNDAKKCLFANFCFDYFRYNSTSNDLYSKIYKLDTKSNSNKNLKNKIRKFSIFKIIMKVILMLFKIASYLFTFLITCIIMYILIVPNGMENISIIFESIKNMV